MTLHELFTTDTTGLAEVTPSSSIRLHHGDRFDLRIALVRKTLNGADLRMLAYNGSIPGPTLHVDQGSEITVHVINDGEVVDTTGHQPVWPRVERRREWARLRGRAARVRVEPHRRTRHGDAVSCLRVDPGRRQPARYD